MSTHLRRWGAVYLLLGLFVASWVGQLFAMRDVILEDGYIAFWASTFENWQSEWLQLLVQALVVVGWAEVMFRRSLDEVRRLETKVDRLIQLMDVMLEHRR